MRSFNVKEIVIPKENICKITNKTCNEKRVICKKCKVYLENKNENSK